MKVLKIAVLLMSLGVAQSCWSQNLIDSLKSLYPQQENHEKALTLAELCYQLAYDDSRSAIQYGRLSYETALITEDKTLIAQTLNDWSIAYLVEGNFDSVLVLSEKCLTIRTELDDSVGMAKTLNKMANAQYELGQEEASLKNNLKAIGIFNRHGLEEYSGRILANVATLYEGQGLLDLALRYYQKAKETAKKSNNTEAYYMAMSSEATCHSKLQEFDIAEEKLLQALAFYEVQGNVDLAGSVYQNLGFNASRANRKKEAFNFYLEALEKYKENNSTLGQSLINVNIGQFLMDDKKYEEAELYLNRGLDMALKSRSIPQLQHAYKALTRLKNLEGNYQEADQYFDLYEAYMDSIFNSETRSAIADMQVKYETAQKMQDLVQEKLKSRNTQLWLLVAVISIGLLLLLILYLRHRKKLGEEKLKLEAVQRLEKERGRIARDLHDNLGADLTLITSKIDIQAFKQNDINFKNDLENISEISKSANAQLRDTIWSIHKSSLDLGELAAKMRDYGKRAFDESETSVTVTCHSEDFLLPPSKALHIFRISQEFLNNSLKYAQASKISIQLNSDQITLSDNGIGFNPESVERGYGLNNMVERTKEFGGTLAWHSPESGIELVINY